MIFTFKCHGCGGDMKFDMEKQKLVCTICELEMSVEDYDVCDLELEDAKSLDDSTKSFQCPSCGATMLAEASQVRCVCAYCETETAVFSEEEGRIRPEKMIPFSLKRADAEIQLKKWWMNNECLPRYNEKKLKITMEPMYIPVWLVDSNVRTDMSAVVQRTEWVKDFEMQAYRKYYGHANPIMDPFLSSRDNSYGQMSDKSMHTKRLLIYKKISSYFDRMPNNASYHFSNDRFMGIEPYDYKNLQDFTPGYLSGLSAEQYSIEAREVIPSAIKRIKEYGEEQCKRHILYSEAGMSEMESDMGAVSSVELKGITYALVPLWICSYTYGKNRYMVYINGQTGKVNGDIATANEANRKDFWMIVGATFAEIFCVCFFIACYMNTNSILKGADGFLIYCLIIILLIPSYMSLSSKKKNSDSIEYNTKSRKEPISIILRRLIVGAVFGILNVGNIKLLKDLTLSSVFFIVAECILFTLVGTGITMVFFTKYEKKSFAEEETVEYWDYLKDKKTVVLESSEKIL